MECSTKSSIVEHVARELGDEFYQFGLEKGWWSSPHASLDDLEANDLHMERWEFEELVLVVFRPVIRATLEWLGEHVSRDMTAADPETCTTDTHAFYEAKFRAMLSTALKEMEGGE
jgi:hypothetical protein